MNAVDRESSKSLVGIRYDDSTISCHDWSIEYDIFGGIFFGEFFDDEGKCD